jgi:hypothetical protein
MKQATAERTRGLQTADHPGAVDGRISYVDAALRRAHLLPSPWSTSSLQLRTPSG